MCTTTSPMTLRAVTYDARARARGPRPHLPQILDAEAQEEHDAEVLALLHPDPREAARAAFALVWNAAPSASQRLQE